MAYIMEPILAKYLAFFRSDIGVFNRSKVVFYIKTLVVFVLAYYGNSEVFRYI